MASYPFNVGDRVELHPADDSASRSTATIAAIESDHLALTRPKTTSGALTPIEAGERWLLRCFNRRRGISEFITTVLRVFPGPLGEVH
ncbi:MAG TPA: flagellar brake domain-containing protein, partial [Bacillota bacterium]